MLIYLSPYMFIFIRTNYRYTCIHVVYRRVTCLRHVILCYIQHKCFLIEVLHLPIKRFSFHSNQNAISTCHQPELHLIYYIRTQALICDFVHSIRLYMCMHSFSTANIWGEHTKNKTNGYITFSAPTYMERQSGHTRCIKGLKEGK